LGHKGSAYSKDIAIAYKSNDGKTFYPVEELSGGPEYQCGFQWGNNLYLGTGGWTNNRTGGNTAKIYRYDGQNRQEVLSNISKNGITSFASCGNKIFALADSGWEADLGTSYLFESSDGIEWKHIHTFNEPEMKKIEVVENKTLIVLGGKNDGYGVIYINNEICTKN